MFFFCKDCVPLWAATGSPSFSIHISPYCSNLPSSAALPFGAGPHNAQMVAIVMPCPFLQTAWQEALLCTREGQEARLTMGELDAVKGSR